MKDKIEPVYGLMRYNPANELAMASFEYIHRDIEDIKHQFIRLGFHLYECRQMKYYENFGYSDFYEFVAMNYHMDKSAVSRHISLFERFCRKSGPTNTMFLDDKYEDYSYSQLCEMVSLPDDKMRQIKSDMTVSQIRDMKRSWKNDSSTTAVATSQQKKERKKYTECAAFKSYNSCKKCYYFTKNESCPFDRTEISALGVPLTVRKEDDFLQTKGCKGHSCFNCKSDCRVRQKECYCVEAPLGAPFGCTTMHVIENLRDELGEKCQFVNQDMAYHNAVNEAVPCCKKCSIADCGYRCQRAGLQENDIVQTVEYQEITQPELPVLKSNDQRREFIKQYQSWNVWVDIPETGERYYKYELENDVKLVVKATLRRRYLGYDFKASKNKYEKDKTFGAEEYYLFEGDMSAYEARANISVLINYLKEYQKQK